MAGLLFTVVSLVTQELTLGLALLAHAIWQRDARWFWLAGFAASVEFWISLDHVIKDRARTYHDITREIFSRYSSCDFAQVSVRRYFDDSPGLFDEVLGHLPQGRYALSKVGQRIEQATGQPIGVPHVIVATPKSGSPALTPIPTPTSFDTADGGWIITSEPPEHRAPLTRFLLLHEMYHHIESFTPGRWRQSVFDAVKILIGVAAVVPVTLSNTLVSIALLWILMCVVIEREVDDPANELTVEIRADEFAIERTPSEHTRGLAKIFALSRDRAPKESYLARTGFVRWQRALEACQRRRQGTNSSGADWRLGSGPSPKYSFVSVPLLIVFLSIQPWRWSAPPALLGQFLLALGAGATLFQLLRAYSVSQAFTNLRGARAPLRNQPRDGELTASPPA